MLQISRFRQVLILLVLMAGVIFTLPNFFYGRVEQHNDAVALIDSGISTEQAEADVALWPSFLPSNLVNLGLDLRGGAHLLAEVRVEEVYATTIDAMWPEVRDVLAAERDTVGFITREDSEPGVLRVRISEAAGIERAVELVRGLSEPVVTLTGAGASTLKVTSQGNEITVELSDAEKLASDDRTVKQALEIIRRRIDAAGTREPSIQRQGDSRILIQVPGAKSAEELQGWIGTTAQLNFHPVVGRTTDATQSPGVGNFLAPSVEEDGVYYVLERNAVVSGEELVDAQPSFDQNGQPAVSFRFNPAGARKFGTYTSENVGAPFAIVLDNEVISAPTIRQAITGGSGIISGSFTIEESTNLAVLLRAGALPAGLDFLEKRTIGPELGADSVQAGKMAAIVGFALIMVFMGLTYGLFGWIANVALVLNVCLIMGALSILGATLTLPGIAGIVLTMGMAVDANVLVYERIREELKTAKGPARAIELGYERAMSAIVDANITTILTAAILWFVGSGPVRGFATTLGIGIVTSVFTALFVTRLFIVWWFQRRRPKSIEV
ncbi:protein-export membrane protein SecD [Marivivens niveibacter]|uniref:Protein translocase subunit SecD n=1 Tax=Marivivens niveibacter TaxID=1930667 RepID=A0A251X2L2_9RHOB|nr:protein translocase subunit SecD [Marivivens niveibacter]OUD10655.1 protein-export membrane protein SecD [Marivivens niveibacter]